MSHGSAEDDGGGRFPELTLRECAFPELELPEAVQVRRAEAAEAFIKSVEMNPARPLADFIAAIMPRPPLRVIANERWILRGECAGKAALKAMIGGGGRKGLSRDKHARRRKTRQG